MTCTPSPADMPPPVAASITKRHYSHLLKSKRIEDLWLLAILVRHTDLARILHDDKPLASAIVRDLRLKDTTPETPEQARGIAVRLRATYQQMHKHRRQYRLPKVLAWNLDLLTQRMGLSVTEQRVMALAILLRTNHTLLLAAGASRPSVNVIEQLTQIIGSPTRAVISAIAPGSLLRRAGLVNFTTGGHIAMNMGLLRASFRRLAIDRYTNLDAMLGGIVRAGQRSSMTLEAYAHLRPEPCSIVTLLDEALRSRRQGVNVLLYGAPGTGKTELARLLAQEMAASVFEVSFTELEGASLEPKERLGCAATAQLLLKKLRALLVFDEIDAVFTDGSALFGKPTTAETAKCWVNDLLENNPIPMVWIANRIGGMDPAFIRRFDLVVHVDIPPQSSRHEFLRKECTFLDDSQLRRLSHADCVTPAVVLRAANVATRMSTDAKVTGRLMEDVIDGVLKAQGRPLVRQQCRHTTSGDYDISLCNTDVDLVALRDGLRRNPSSRICLHGPPGTGKSAFGIWIAQQLDRPLLVKRISDLQSPWLGEMERNLAKAFEQANRDESVLQIDEVDSYLRDRRNAQRSWEVSQVNEFLTQLEQFDGVFIASTNLMDGLDPAAMRRFDFKIEMDYLNESQVRDLLLSTMRHMGIDGPDTGSLADRIRGMDRLTPGDFAVLARQHRTHRFIGFDQVIDALRMEQALKSPSHRRIGFV